MRLLSSLWSRPSLSLTLTVARGLSTVRPTKKAASKKNSVTLTIEPNLAPESFVTNTPERNVSIEPNSLYDGFKKAKALTQLYNLGSPILTPPVSRDKNESTPFWGSNGGTYRLAQTLPTLNASAILDPKGFCQHSASAATSKSGTDAAKRLLRGKYDLLNVMKLELQNKRRPKSFLLKGHGIPEQLLQNHLNLADALLKSHQNARLLTCSNPSGDLTFDLLRIRAKDGTSTHSSWSSDDSDESIGMELYLTVMDRLAKNLSECLNWDHPPVAADGVGEDNDFIAVPMHALPHPHRWNVDILRGSVFPAMEEELTPVIEWIPREGSMAPGHVCIRLQGIPIYTGDSLRRKKKSHVTLVFDACFRKQVHTS